MKIRGEQLKKIAAQKGVSVEQLASSVERTGLAGDRAVSAVNNWMRGSDHPHCRTEDIQRLAAALQVSISEIAQFRSVYKYHKGSPRKAKLLVDLIRGKDYETALNMLTFTTKRAAVDVKKTLLAALADAQQQEADESKLVVVESTVGNGPHMKRFQPKDRGRAHPILVRSSHITIGLEERASKSRKK